MWLFNQASYASSWSQLLRHVCFNQEFQDAKARKIIPGLVSGTVDGRNPAFTTWESKNPENIGINYLLTGAGYLSSTVVTIFIIHETPAWKGNNPILRGLTITMVIINHLLLNGMILQDAVTGEFGKRLKQRPGWVTPPKTNIDTVDTQHDGVENVSSFQTKLFLVSMLDFRGYLADFVFLHHFDLRLFCSLVLWELRTGIPDTQFNMHGYLESKLFKMGKVGLKSSKPRLKVDSHPSLEDAVFFLAHQ